LGEPPKGTEGEYGARKDTNKEEDLYLIVSIDLTAK
jgi:hypothetical protein